MPQTIQVLPGSDSQMRFPERCVACGAAKETESNLVINRLVMRGQKQEQVSLKYAVPHCDPCARSTKAVFLAGFIPLMLGFVLLGGAAFVVVTFYASWLGLDEMAQPSTFASWVLGGAAGLVVGLVAGFLCELLARVVLLPVYGRSLYQAPLLTTQFLSDADYVAGLTAKLDKEAKHLTLIFANDEVAKEFLALNKTAVSLQH
ncbi:MAG: hypothetical protein H6658_14705 [Ardenticatenaceae bacterium]|nr:hypothetical protein [Ardenticatenaceae bacterium]